MEIQVLDDSNDETSTLVEQKVNEIKLLGFDITHVKRVKNIGFKAGALQEGMHQCKGEFIAIFDADFMPEPDFLRKTIPHFKNPSIEWFKRDGPI